MNIYTYIIILLLLKFINEFNKLFSSDIYFIYYKFCYIHLKKEDSMLRGKIIKLNLFIPLSLFL